VGERLRLAGALRHGPPVIWRCGATQLFAARLRHAGSAAVAAWIGLGARDDPPGKSGAGHLVEHLLLQRSGPAGDDLVAEVESRGGEVQAYQYKDGIRLAIRVPAADAGFALSALACILSDQAWSPDDVASERAAVVNELHELADWPEAAATQLAMDGLWPGSDWQRPVGGVAAEVPGLTAADVAGAWAAARARPLLLGVVGPGSPGAYLRRAAAAMSAVAGVAGRWPAAVRPGARAGVAGRPAGPCPPAGLPACPSARLPAVVRHRHQPSSQAYISLALAAPPRSSPAFPVIEVADALLAGGAGSLLLGALRGDNPLAYGVVSDLDIGVDLNAWSLTFGVAADRVSEALAVVLDEIGRVRTGDVSTGDLDRARRYVAGRLALQLDNPSLYGRWLLLELLAHGRAVSAGERSRQWLAVGRQALAAAVTGAVAGGACLAVVGDVVPAEVQECGRLLVGFLGAAREI